MTSPQPIDAEPADASTDTAFDGSSDDAALAMCHPPSLGAWSNPSSIVELAAAGFDGTPMVRADGLELYWKSGRNGLSLDIYRSVRGSLIADWGPAMNVAELNTASNEGSPELSPDGLTIYLSSDRSGSVGFMDIYVATRPNVTSAWTAPARLAQLSTTAEDEGMMVMPSDLVAYMHSNRSGVYRIYRMTRATKAAAWGAPAEITELSDGQYENPMVSTDDCRMYVQGTRQDTNGNADLYLSTRAQPSGAWGTPVKINPPSTFQFDADPWISADERYLMFATGNSLPNLELVEAIR